MQTFSKRSERLSASLGEEKETTSNTNKKGRPKSPKDFVPLEVKNSRSKSHGVAKNSRSKTQGVIKISRSKSQGVNQKAWSKWYGVNGMEFPSKAWSKHKRELIEELLLFCQTPQTLTDIAAKLNFADKYWMKRSYIDPLLGIALSMTDAKAKNAPTQKYVTIATKEE